MVGLMSLWLPIILSAVGVFFASFIMHTVLTYHRSDVGKLPSDKEDAIMDAVRRLDVPPGDYAAPHAGSMAGMRDPAFVAKVTKGPRAFMTVFPGAPPSMGPYLGQWFVYSIVVTVFSAYLVGGMVGPGANFRTVLHFMWVATFIAYGLALPQLSIWYHRSWGTTLRSLFDSLIYGLVTGAVFAWLWPR